MADFDAGSIDATLDVDRTPFTRGLELAQEQAHEFEDDGIHVRLDLDDGDALVAFDDIELRADELDGRDIRLRVEVDDSDADRGLDDVESRLGRPGSGSGGEGGSGLLGSFSTLLGLGAKVGLGLGIATLPAIVASAVPAVIGLSGLFGTLAAGIGAFGLVAKSDFTDMQATLKDLTTQQQNLNNATTDTARQAALKAIAADTAKLQGPAGAAAKAYQAIETAVAGLKTSTSGSVFPVMTEFFKAAADALPKISPLIDATAKALLPFATDLDKAVNGPGFTKLVSWLSSNIGPDLRGVGDFLLNVGQGALHIFQLLSPLASFFNGGILKVSSNFNSWSQSLTSSAIQPFLNFIKSNGPLVAQTFDDLAKAIGGIAGTLSTISYPALSLLDATFRAIGTIDLQPLAKAVGDVAFALIPLMPSLASLANDIIPILAGVIEYVLVPDLNLLSGFLKWLTNGSILSDIALGLIGVTAAMWGLDAALDANPIGVVILAVALFAAGLYELVTNFQAVSKFLSGPWGTALSLFLVAVFPMIGIPALIIGQWQRVTKFFEALPGDFTRWGKTLWNGFLSGITTGWNAVAKFFEAIPGKIMDILKALPGDLKTASQDAIAAYVLGFVYAGVAIWDWWTKVIPTIIGLIGDAGTWLVKKGNDIAMGMLKGITDAAVNTWNWFKALPGTIASFFLTAPGWITDKGVQIIAGLWNGIYSYVAGTLWPWFRGIPNDIANFFGNAINWLTNAGKAVMEGFLHGIEDGLNDVKNYLTGVANKVTKWKGPLDYDRTILIPHGNAIMDGLNEGLNTGFGRVQTNLKGMASRISQTVGVTGAATISQEVNVASKFSLTGATSLTPGDRAQVAAMGAVVAQLTQLVNVTKDLPTQTGDSVKSNLAPVLRQQSMTDHSNALMRGRQGAVGVSSDGS